MPSHPLTYSSLLKTASLLLRPFLTSLCFIPILLFFSTCNKASTEPELPPATHSGKNFIAFRVNGRAIVISGYRSLVYKHSVGANCYYTLNNDLIIDGTTEDRLYRLKIYFKFNSVTGIYNIIDQYPYEAFFSDYNMYSVNSIHQGTINVDYFENGICSGIFAFDAVNTDDSVVHITDGRFDIVMD